MKNFNKIMRRIEAIEDAAAGLREFVGYSSPGGLIDAPNEAAVAHPDLYAEFCELCDGPCLMGHAGESKPSQEACHSCGGSGDDFDESGMLRCAACRGTGRKLSVVKDSLTTGTIKSADVDSGVSGVLYKPVNLIFQTNPLNPDLLFVEAEDDTGKSVRVGLWGLDKDGFATLRITPPDTSEPDAMEAEIERLGLMADSWRDRASQHRKEIKQAYARACDCDSYHSEDDAYCWACGGKIKEGE